MRNPDRLNDFYDRLKTVHKECVPDWRFGQLISNVFGEMVSLGKDPFFVEEDEMSKFIEAYFRR